MRLQGFRAAVLTVIACTGLVAVAGTPAATAFAALHSPTTRPTV
jgi:hypothetical protein